MNLFPYQQEAARFLASKDRAGLFDEMGLGKTASTIAALDELGEKRALVICPAMLRENWLNEFRKWGRSPRKVVKGMTVHDLIAWQRGRFDVLVASYEMATRWLSRINEAAQFIPVLVLDESHYLKNKDSARAKAILGEDAAGVGGIVQWALRAWMLTGTPMANDPVDIYPFLRFARQTTAPQHRWAAKYMHVRPVAFGSRQSPRDEMTGRLRSKIQAVSIRRTKDDVGLQLPPIFLTEAIVDGDTTEIVKLLREHPGLEGAIVQAVERGGLSFLDAQHVATLRRLVGLSKAVPYAGQLIDELRQTDDKRVVYGIHRGALQLVQDELLAAGIHAVLVNGDTPEKQRIAAVQAFQTDRRCRVFIGNIRAAGTGITLTAAAEIDMLESDWTPAGNAQALMRVHRIGQTRNVFGRFITLAKSIDLAVNRVVAEKVRDIAAIDGVEMAAVPSRRDP